MIDNLLIPTYTLPLILQREDAILRGGLCFSVASYQQLHTALHRFLHPKEQICYKKLQHPKRQQSYLIGRFCAKQAIAVLTSDPGLTSSYIENGIFQQPVVTCQAANNIQVSISHTDRVGAAIAFPEAHPMAIDIETINLENDNTIKTQMTEAEQKLISPFFSYSHLWTAKEALSKVLRCGFMISYELLEIESIEKNRGVLVYFKKFHQYKALSFQLGNIMCSIVFPRKTELRMDIVSIQRALEKLT